MKYNDSELSSLRNSVKARMSAKRFIHTLGVEKMALFIGEAILPDCVSELRAAAILHDVAKELPNQVLLELMSKSDCDLSCEDYESTKLYHSFAAAPVIKSDFPQFATPDILSAVHNHTAGHPDMSTFDSIIFLSDFVEEGRVYPDCVALRNKLLERFKLAKNRDQYQEAFELTLLECLDSLILALIRLNDQINTRTVLTRNAFLTKILHK